MSTPALTPMDLGDVELCYIEIGQGDPVVFVHGGLSDYRIWSTQIKAIGRQYRAISYSRRYHYPNSPIPPDVDDQMTPHVRDLENLIRRLGAVPAHIVGDSWGAYIALRLAIESPEFVRSLSLAEPPVLPLLRVDVPPTLRQMLVLLMRRPAAAVAFARFGAGVVAPATKMFRAGDFDAGMKIFARGVLGTEVFENLDESRLEQARANTAPLAAELLGDGFEPLHETAVRGVSVPVLLIEGERTNAILRLLLHLLAELLPKQTLCVIPDASHSPHEQNPAFYNASLMRFLESAD